MKPGTPFDQIDWLLLGGLLLVAAVPRLIDPGWTEFKPDEARLLALAWDMADGRAWSLRGIASSAGIPNFPAAVWLYALPLVVWPHVFAPTLFTGLANTAAVALCFWVGRRVFGREAALVAALMLAVSPWAIIHSRKIWAQNLLIFLTMGWAAAGVLAYVENRRWWLAVHLFIAALAFQVHLAAASLVLASAALLLLLRRRVSWGALAAGGAAALLTVTPFVVDLWRAGDLSPDHLPAAVGETTGGGFSFAAFRHAARLATGWEMHALAGPEAFEAYLATRPGQVWILIVWASLILWGLAGLVGQASTRPGEGGGRPARLLLLVWAIAPFLTFLWFPVAVELHYLLPVVPALYLAAGRGVGRLAGRPRRLVWPVLILSAAWQLWLWFGLHAFLQTRATPGGFGEPLIFQLQAADLARDLAREKGDIEILIGGGGEEPLRHDTAAVYDLHLRDLPHRFVDLSRSAVFPSRRTVVLVGAGVGEWPLVERLTKAAEQTTWLPRRPGEPPLAVILLPPDAAPKPAVPLAEEPLLANFVRLLGYYPLTTEGEWVLIWSAGVAAEVDYHFFNHLVDPTGARLAQVDAPAFYAGQWREGDTVLSRFAFDPPPVGNGPWTMRVGMYRYPSLENVPYLDEAANPYTDAIEVDPRPAGR